MPYIPDKGDIIWFDFNPSSSREIIKHRPAFVISRKAFNEHVGLSIVAPITSTVRGIKLEVVLPDELETAGAVLIHQLKSQDFVYRQAKFIEKAPLYITDKVTELVNIIVN